MAQKVAKVFLKNPSPPTAAVAAAQQPQQSAQASPEVWSSSSWVSLVEPQSRLSLGHQVPRQSVSTSLII